MTPDQQVEEAAARMAAVRLPSLVGQLTLEHCRVLARAALGMEPASVALRATHRVTCGGHPPTYCLREADAIAVARSLEPESSVLWLIGSDRRTWTVWRPWP